MVSQCPLERGVATCHIPGVSGAKRPSDTNRFAKLVVDLAAGERSDALTPDPANKLVSAGLVKHGETQAERLSPKKRA